MGFPLRGRPPDHRSAGRRHDSLGAEHARSDARRLGWRGRGCEDKAPQLQRDRETEETLRVTFENKQKKAANYDAYRSQLGQMEQSFGTMLRQLPGKTEIPSLIVDVSQTGLAAGLQEKLFQPQPEIRKDFYAEKPIKITLSGGYHEIANFVSGVASLPRIVTLHDINITPDASDSFDQLTLAVTAKTYRYLEEEAE